MRRFLDGLLPGLSGCSNTSQHVTLLNTLVSLGNVELRFAAVALNITSSRTPLKAPWAGSTSLSVGLPQFWVHSCQGSGQYVYYAWTEGAASAFGFCAGKDQYIHMTWKEAKHGPAHQSAAHSRTRRTAAAQSSMRPACPARWPRTAAAATWGEKMHSSGIWKIMFIRNGQIDCCTRYLGLVG